MLPLIEVNDFSLQMRRTQIKFSYFKLCKAEIRKQFRFSTVAILLQVTKPQKTKKWLFKRRLAPVVQAIGWATEPLSIGR